MRALPPDLSLHSAPAWEEIPARTAYKIARLRQEVFVVEQDCAYLDLDGRDLEPGAVQFWVEDTHGGVVATLRVLPENRVVSEGSAPDPGTPAPRSIGRVITAPLWRGNGIAAVLLEAAIASCAGHPILLHAQSYLTDWYAAFGFAACGPEHLEDGIPHTPMRRG